MPLACSLTAQGKEKKIACYIEKALIVCNMAASQYLAQGKKAFMFSPFSVPWPFPPM